MRLASGVPPGSFWARLAELERNEVRRVAVPIRFGTDQPIMRQGDVERHLVVILPARPR